MDLLYSDQIFRRHFHFFHKNRSFATPENMQDVTFDQKLTEVLSTLKVNSNEPQVSCCMDELADILNEASTDEMQLVESKDSPETVLHVMEEYFSNVDIQQNGVFTLHRFLEGSKSMKSKLINLQVHDLIVRLMTHYTNDIVIQVMGCRMMIILVENVRIKEDINTMGVIDIIATAMEHFDREEELHFPALQVLTELLDAKCNLQQNFVEQKLHVLVLEILENNLESGEVAEKAYALLSMLVDSTRLSQHFLDTFIVDIVFKSMAYHADISDVQSAGCALLVSLAGNKNFHESLVFKNVRNVISTAMIKHRNHETIQKNGIQVFSLLRETLLQPLDHKIESAYFWLNSILVAMATNCDHPRVLIMACSAISELSDHFPGLLILISDDHDKIPLHSAIMAALVLHIDDAEVCQAACRAVACTAKYSDEIQQALITKGVYLYIIQAMENHPKVASVQQYGSQSLRMLCMTKVENMELLIKCGAWDAITNSFTHFTNEAEVQREAIAIIACLATDIELLRHQCAAEQLYSAVLKAMSTFPNNISLIEVCLEAIGVFSAHETMSDLMVFVGVLKAFLDVMNIHVNEVAIQQKGCILIQVFSRYFAEDHSVRAVSAIIKAMRKFAHDEQMQEEGCVALKLVAQVDKNNSEILVNQCAHERLFAILDEFGDKPKLIELASDVLWFLGCQRKLNSRMLLSACAGGLVRGAHCLIQLDADVNVGESTNTPLCAACKNNKEEMVRFLLTQGISDVQTALNLCLEMEHHSLVGILLQKLGHDRGAGVISWSGLNLGSLYPEWLTPSLSGNAYGLTVENRRWENYLRSAELAFKQRFQILQKLNDLAIFCKYEDREVIVKAVENSDNSDDTSKESAIWCRNSEDDALENGILSEKAPLRVSSLSGAPLPYSSYDPRVVVPLTVGDPILLPTRTALSSINSTSFASASFGQEVSQGEMEMCSEFHDARRRSQSMLNLSRSQTPLDDGFYESTDDVLLRPEFLRRTASDSNEPEARALTPHSFELPAFAFMYRDNTPARRSKPKAEYDLPEEEPFRQEMEMKKFPSKRSKRRKTCIFAKGKASNAATVRVIDVSGNRINDLRPLATAGEYLLMHLVNIERLDLSNNELSYLPSTLCVAMPMLHQVTLNHNKFEVFPFCLVQCPRLKTLDLSHNNLNWMLNPPNAVSKSRSIVLENLSLANNSLKAFPVWLADLLPGLMKLSVAGNEIDSLPDTSLKMTRLKTLDMSNNRIEHIPERFLAECCFLENLNASSNELTTLPESVADHFQCLKTVRLAHNNLAKKTSCLFPRFVLLLPNLKVLDLSHNKLTHLPPPENWATCQLKELILANNNIKRLNLDQDVSKWSSLERLVVSHNSLNEVPSGIGSMTTLTSLDLSHNPGITRLPDEMGRLSNLWDLQLDGLKLDIEEALLSKTKNLIAFLHSKLMNSVPYYRMKLVTVGLAGRGKTTLLNQLLKSKAPPAQDELVIRDWVLRDTKASCKCCHHKSVIYTINTWDFKGREDLYHVFQCFLSSRTLYLVVYDVTKGGEEYEALRSWLQNIHACAPDVPVMLVGTHLDKIPKDRIKEVLDEMKDRAQTLFLSPGLPEIKAHVVLNCTQETSGIQTLRNKIVDLVVKCKTKGHSLLGSHVPQKFVHLQGLLLRVSACSDRNVLRRIDLKKLLIDNEVLMSETELDQAVKFLHEAGVLVHYDDPIAHLNDLFFIQPEWLCHVISSAVTAGNATGLVTNGIIERDDLVDWIKEVPLPYHLVSQFLRLLERFGVLLPVSESQFLMPSRLRPRPLSIVVPDLAAGTWYRRLYQMAFIPLGFWSRLIARLLSFQSTMNPDNDDRKTPAVDYWCDGIQFTWSSRASFTISQDTSGQFGVNVLTIIVPSNHHGYYLLGCLADHVDTLIDEWFPSLSGVDSAHCLPLVSRLCPCIKCEGEDSHVFTLDECIEQALHYEEIACPKTTELLPIEKLAPDVAMADMKLQKLFINEDELMFEQKKEFVLGDGGYGTVYKAKYFGKVVAVKVFHTEGDVNPHRSLRQEVPFLAHLRHPSIITVIGVLVRPRAIVLEIAPLGSLSSLLSKRKLLSRGLQHRIALQVSEGLAYLHRHRIVYRDLKPHNVLVFSLSLSIVINAKITDFGIARYAALYGLMSCEGTPGYRAPEVARGDVAYSKEVDMYSLGMVLYELVTGGRRPFEDLRFRHELDAAVMQGRMVDPITDSGSSPWPDVADLIEHLLEPRGDMRPTAEEVVERLSTAELLCLKRNVPVCKGQTVECMAVRNFTESDEDKIEVWMGSGLSENCSGQVSWVNLTDRGDQGCQGTVIRDKRVNCMISVNGDYVLVGTQSGRIWVFDAWSHKCLHALQPLDDPVVALRHYSNIKAHDDIVIAGLANGQLAIYQTKDLIYPEASRQLIQLCEKQTEGGECAGDCRSKHSVACLAVAQKCVYCGCGNDIVVLKLDKNMEIKRRWSIEDRHERLVVNIAVGSFIWTSTENSGEIDYWDVSQSVLRGTVNCENIMRTRGFEGESSDLRVVCMVHSQQALWVGLGTGHIIVLSPSTCEALCVLNRHAGTVRCMATARSASLSRPISLIMTGGMGFIDRPRRSGRNANSEFGHVLVWEADLGEQVKRLHASQIKRQQSYLVDEECGEDFVNSN